jgi:nucleoside-diphosphate-sugar epimerase
MASRETILVTGATGFIGGWLVESLYLRDAADVRAGLRQWGSAVRLARFPMDMVLCDVMDPQQLREAMEGATHVVHCAYGSREVTVQGTRNVLEAAHRLGVERVVYLSTAEVYGNVAGEVDESFPYQLTGEAYTESKIEAERACWEYHEGGLPVTVIRPSIVYGPFGRTWTTELALKLQSGNWGAFEGHGEGFCNLIYVVDLVDGILLALRHEEAAGEAFNLCGPEVVSWNEYFSRFNDALGLPPLGKKGAGQMRLQTLFMEPVRRAAKLGVAQFGDQIRSVGKRSRLVKRLLKSAEHSLKTSPRLEDLPLYGRQARYSTAKAGAMLGFQPRFHLDDGLGLTVRWLEHVGVVNHR